MLASVVASAARAALADPLLDCTSPNNDGSGYGGYAWTTMTRDLDVAAAAAGGTVATTADLSNVAALLRYDGLWVDVRQPDATGTLSPAEASALSAYIATGRRVVLVGGNSAYANWNASILGLVGGTDGGTLATRVYPQLAIVPLTIGVSGVYARAGDAATATSAAVSLFAQRVATVWGPAHNVVVVLNANLNGDDDAGQAANAAFDRNLAQWAAGTLADPLCLWNAPAGGAWRTVANWGSILAMPAVADDAVFNRSSAYTTTVDAPVVARNLRVLSDQLTLAFTTPTATLTVGSAVTVNRSLSLTGTGRLSAASVAVAAGASLSVGAGVTLTAGSVSANGSVTVAGRLALTGPTASLGSMSFSAGSGQLDVDSAAVVLAGTDVATATADVARGFANGAWTGGGITSAVAAADAGHHAAVGVIADVGPGGSALYPAFAGQAVTAADVLVRETLYGDTNLDGVVNAADYTRVDAGYIGQLSGWANGDFNFDGVVDGSDYALMDDAFNTQPAVAALATTAVPEPTWLAAGMATAVGWTARWGRRGRAG